MEGAGEALAAAQAAEGPSQGTLSSRGWGNSLVVKADLAMFRFFAENNISFNAYKVMIKSILEVGAAMRPTPYYNALRGPLMVAAGVQLEKDVQPLSTGPGCVVEPCHSCDGWTSNKSRPRLKFLFINNGQGLYYSHTVDTRGHYSNPDYLADKLEEAMDRLQARVVTDVDGSTAHDDGELVPPEPWQGVAMLFKTMRKWDGGDHAADGS